MNRRRASQLALGALMPWLASCLHPTAAPDRQSAEHARVTATYEYDYLRYLPKDYRSGSANRWPLLIFLHGASERGGPLDNVKRTGLPRLIEEGADYPFIIISPHCPPDEWWNLAAVEELIGQVAREYRVDPGRIYLTGLSMGGFGVWALAERHPERYAAVIPICGGGELTRPAALRDLPIWAFHGAEDLTVPPAASQKLVDAVNAAGGRARLTLYPGIGHDSWSATYANPEIYEWLLAQHRRSAKVSP
jgi:predicted peptidase